MEGGKMIMVCIAYITVFGVFASGVAALREGQGAIAPSPMESGAVAMGVPAALVGAALASMVAFGCFF
ncbi:hypothetical protein V6N13_143630 [Hibiscus sabdariffa]|uniref:Uncharacterized protein n=1 Tax=Hibiscus sabdariffa TaxID=183260 RepID=A0ABR2FI53_9ROSI